MIFLLFNLLIMVYHADVFVYVEESLHIWDKCHLMMVYDSFSSIHYFQFARVLLRIFAPIFITVIDL